MSKNDKKCTVLLGSQWGDEGKGKLLDLISAECDIVCRYNGGSNAGHTIVVGKDKFAFHLIPSGILHPKVICLAGNGVVMHLPSLFNELKQLEDKNIDYKGRLKISDRSQLLFDFHREVDGMRETELSKTKNQIGTTKQGIGPCYATKAERTGLRVGDLINFEQEFPTRFKRLVEGQQKRWGFKCDVEKEIERYREYAKVLKEQDMILDGVYYVNKSIDDGRQVLVEGANATMLDLDFGTYPYVTSSSPTVGGACTGLGIPPSKIGDVIGIVKAYTTRVGDGPFPTELNDAIGEKIRDVGREFGTTTGRPRRCGWLDAVQVKYAHMVNNFTQIGFLKLDVLSGLEEVKIGVKYLIDGKELASFPQSLTTLSNVEVIYESLKGWKEDISNVRKFEDLPENCKAYCRRFETLTGTKITWIGVGPERESIIRC